MRRRTLDDTRRLERIVSHLFKRGATCDRGALERRLRFVALENDDPNLVEVVSLRILDAEGEAFTPDSLRSLSFDAARRVRVAELPSDSRDAWYWACRAERAYTDGDLVTYDAITDALDEARSAVRVGDQGRVDAVKQRLVERFEGETGWTV